MEVHGMTVRQLRVLLDEAERDGNGDFEVIFIHGPTRHFIEITSTVTSPMYEQLGVIGGGPLAAE